MKKRLFSVITILTLLLMVACHQAKQQDTSKASPMGDASETEEVAPTKSLGPKGAFVKITPVKDQGESDLCWIYAMLATIESERLMLGDSVNLSADFLARHFMEEQAERCYLMTNAKKGQKDELGAGNITTRGMASMTLRLLQAYGITHWDAYHLDVNFDVVARKVKKTVEANRGKGLQEMSKSLIDMLDESTRPLPRFVFMLGVEYTTQEFALSVCLPDEYVALTSFTHHPYGKPFRLEVADNYYQDEFLNIPLDSLTAHIDRALTAGHPVCWEGDISEPGFSWPKGFAETKDDGQKENGNQESVADIRQHGFEQGETTDDHCMELIGITNIKGKKYYLAKNSWGKDNAFGGFMYLSEDYLRLKTVAVWMTHDAYELKAEKEL